MIGDVLEEVIRALILLVWRIGFVILLPFIGLYYTRWHRPLIVVAVMIPVLMVSIETHRLWERDPSQFIRAYIYAQTEHFPAKYPATRPLPETLFGQSLPDDWQTYGEARAKLLQPGYSPDYVLMKFLLSIAFFNAMKTGALLAAIGYVYGGFYAMLAAWVARRD